MKDTIVKYIVAIPIVILALVFPSEVKIPVLVNSTPWFWMVLISGFLGFAYVFTRAHVWAKVLVILSLYNCFFSTAPFLSFSAYVFVILSAYFYLLCLHLKSYSFILKIIQCLFFLTATLIFMQFIGKDTLMNFGLDKPICFGLIGNSMQFACFLVCLAPFLIMKSKWYVIPLAVIMVFAQAAGALAAILAGVGFYGLWKLKGFKKLLVILVILSAVIYIHQRGRFATFGIDRYPAWKRTVQLANQKPLTGWGIGTYKVLFPTFSQDLAMKYFGKAGYWWHYEGQTSEYLAWRQTHNCFLQWDFEMGRLGTLVLIWILTYLLYLFWRAEKADEVLLLGSGAAMHVINMTVHFPTRMIQSVPIMICFIAFFIFTMKKHQRNITEVPTMMCFVRVFRKLTYLC